MDRVAEVIDRVIRVPKGRASPAYKAGYDCGKNGANTTNCHYTLFISKWHTAEWERGKKDGEKQCR